MINYLLNSLAYLTRVARIYIAVLTVGNAVEKRLLPRCSAPHRSINEYGQYNCVLIELECHKLTLRLITEQFSSQKRAFSVP